MALTIAKGASAPYYTVSVKEFGARGDGSTDDTTAIQNAINTGVSVEFPEGVYQACNLIQSTNSQRFIARGSVTIRKNANGAILTCSGSEVELNGIGFRGDAASPTFTGNGVVITGDNPRIINCGVRWISGRPLLCTGNGTQILGTCDIYQTTDNSGSGYDIELGISGTATLYQRIIGIRTTQATGGILMTDVGGVSVASSQFGKLTIAAGTSPSGVNGGNVNGNRILGTTTIGLSNAAFSDNTFSNVAITFAGGTSGHSFDASNVLSSGATLTDNSTSSAVVDSRQIPLATYTPVWTAASVNPAIGNGTITGFVSKQGRQVSVTVKIVMGSTTTYGTGEWYISLPYIPSTSIPFIGNVVVLDSGTTFVVGSCQTLQDGTARMVFYGNASTSYRAATPITWANSDELRATLTYST